MTSSQAERLGMRQYGAYAHYVPGISGTAAEAKRLAGEQIPDDARAIEWIHTPPPCVDIRGDAVGIWAAKWFTKPEAARGLVVDESHVAPMFATSEENDGWVRRNERRAAFEAKYKANGGFIYRVYGVREEELRR